MDFNKTYQKLILEAGSAILKFRKWSDSEVEREEADGLPREKRSYMDHKFAFDRWVREKDIPKDVADEVKQSLKFRG